MVLVQIGALVGTLITMVLASSFVRRGFGLGGKSVILVQLLTVTSLAYLLQVNGFIGLYMALAMVALVVVMRVVILVYAYRVSKKVLDGSLGQEAQWAGEIVKSGDQEFIDALQQISQMEMKEIGIMAESKEELREMTLEKVQDNE